MTARKPATKEAAFADPDRPLLRLLNRSDGKPVLVMCGLPGNHDPAHAAAGRLPVRFHKYSDLRLFWREFSRYGPGLSSERIGSYWLQEWRHRFVALIVLTNAGEPIVDERSADAIVDFNDDSKPVLWGEASPEGAVLWRPRFYIADNASEPIYVENEGHYQWVCGSHYQLVPAEEPG